MWSQCKRDIRCQRALVFTGEAEQSLLCLWHDISTTNCYCHTTVTKFPCVHAQTLGFLTTQGQASVIYFVDCPCIFSQNRSGLASINKAPHAGPSFASNSTFQNVTCGKISPTVCEGQGIILAAIVFLWQLAHCSHQHSRHGVCTVAYTAHTQMHIHIHIGIH